MLNFTPAMTLNKHNTNKNSMFSKIFFDPTELFESFVLFQKSQRCFENPAIITVLFCFNCKYCPLFIFSLAVILFKSAES